MFLIIGIILVQVVCYTHTGCRAKTGPDVRGEEADEEVVMDE